MAIPKLVNEILLVSTLHPGGFKRSLNQPINSFVVILVFSSDDHRM